MAARSRVGLRRFGRRYSMGAAVILAGVLFAAAAGPGAARVPGLLVAGVAQDPCQPGRSIPVRPGITGHFAPDSSVLDTSMGFYTGLGAVTPASAAESACAAAAVRADQAWLAAGTVPGRTAALRAMATRALLDLRLAVQPDGAAAAGWHNGWYYSWPRDSSWVAVALADTGHPATAFDVLRFLQRMQAPDGTWASRYQLSGSGAVPGRADELDAVGWVPWAVWAWYERARQASPSRALTGLRELWPMVIRAANAAAASLTSNGLPRPAMDYWENSTDLSTIGTAAALQAGLRAAADLAGLRTLTGTAADGQRWAAAARRLTAGIAATFDRDDYQRVPDSDHDADAAVTLLGPPFAPATAKLRRAVASTAWQLRVPNGGIRPGSDWGGIAGIAWTPETAFFALFDAATGNQTAANHWLAWLAAHRTALGELPEQVNQLGQPSSVAPLSWTDAIVLLALLAQQHQLPTLPVPPP